MFEKIEDYPQYKEFFDDVKAHCNVFRTDAERVIKDRMISRWHESILHNDKWDVFGLIWQDQLHELAQYCPDSLNIVKKYSFIQNCGFSIMNPQCEIYSHVGYTSDVLRCHLGLIVPEGDCCIKVENEVQKWNEGELLFFDDTKMHSTWNKTDQTRVILLTDLKR